MKARLLCLTSLLALAATSLVSSAQDPPKTQGESPFKARLLFLKADWSKAEAAKEIDADLRTALKDAAVPKEAFDQLPRTGPGILFARGMLSVFRAEPFAQVAAWLKERGLIESELAFEAAPRDPTVAPGVRDQGSASAFQDFDVSDLQRFYEDLASQPFVERKAGFQWKVDFTVFEGGTSGFQVVRSLKVAERRRGQQAFEDKDTLEECRFGKGGIPNGAVTVINAFPSESDGAVHYALNKKGFVAVLVVEFGPARAAAPAMPKFVLADEIHFVTPRFERRSPMLGGRGGLRGAPSTGRGSPGSRGSGGVTAAPSGRGNSGPDGAPIATQVTDREQMNIYQLQHIRAEALLVMLQEQFGRTARLTADTERQRIISSTDTQADADKITALIRKLDEPPAAGAAGGDPAATRQEFVIVPLKHVRSESLFPILRQLLPPDARLIEDSDQQRLIVTGSPADIAKVTEAIARLDTPTEADFPKAAGPPPTAGDPNRTARTYESEFMRALQLQLAGQRPNPQPATAGGAADLQRQYQQAEQQAQAEAQKWRALTAKPGGGDVQTTVEIASAKVRLQSLVEQAFLLRQRLQQAELLEMQRRIYGLAHTIEDREKLKDQIIHRRVQDLLNPALQWNPPSAANPPSAFNPLNTPRNPAAGSPLGQSAPAKGAPVSGAIVQLQGNLVHVSIGPEDNIKPGQVLHVFRGNEYVAELEVQTVAATRGVAPGASGGIQNDLAVARVKRKLSELRPDDRVFTEAPAQPAADPTAAPFGSPADRPLSDAVREFNQMIAQSPPFRDLPPLTDDEVVAAIRWKALDPDGWRISEENLKTLLSIADTRTVPKNAHLVHQDFCLATKGAYNKHSVGFTIHALPLGSYSTNCFFREQFVKWVPAPDGQPFEFPDGESAAGDSMPVSAAVAGFNARHKSHSIGKDQPPLTKDEVMTALHDWMNKRSQLPITGAEFQELEKVVQTGELPPKAELEVLTSFQPNQDLLFEAWSVRLVMPHGKGGGTYAYTIRDRWLRVKKLAERQIAWGPVSKSGLQVGVWIDPPNGIFAKGQQFVPHFYFRNAGDKQQSISLPRIMTHGYYETLHITDDSGRNLQFDRDEGPGGPVGWTQLPFAPNDEHEVVGLPVAVGMVKRAPGVETVLCAEPGQQCRLKFSLDDYLNKEDPKDALETGEIRFAAAKE